MDRGLRQADLAREAGISPSYLNLIEHNKRRIGGKLLNDIARALGVEAQSLADGAESALVDALGAAAARLPEAQPELARAEEVASRFPGWTGLIAAQDRRIGALEARLTALADRMAHDPALAASLHEVISSVTAIRSTAAILAGDEGLDSDWRQRFHRNLHGDSERLAESSQALVRYLEDADSDRAAPLSAQEELAAFLSAEGWHLPALEGPEPAAPETVIERAKSLRSRAGRALAARWLARYREDAAALPVAALEAALGSAPSDLAELATALGADLPRVLRRIACLPERPGTGPYGLAICDGAGAVTLLKPVADFTLPFTTGACPLWPLFEALSRPGQPIRAEAELPGVPGARFLCHAVAHVAPPARFGAPPVLEATMLVQPWSGAAMVETRPVGPGCHICPRTECAARREPSLLS